MTVVDAGTATAVYARLAARRRTCLGLTAAALVLLLVADAATGPAMLPVGEVVRAIAGRSNDAATVAIVWAIRLPQALMAVLVGSALGVTGALLQTVLNNPLASSYTLGVSAGAGFGAALAIVAGTLLPLPEAQAVPISAFAFAAMSCAIVASVGRMRGATADILVLAGIACLFLFQALLALVQVLASPEALQQIVFWLFGSLLRSTWTKVSIMTIVLAVAVVPLARMAWPLTALRLGDDRARALGAKPEQLRLAALAIVAVLTGVAVSFVGTVGFVGLVAPHLARPFVGEDQRSLLPASALFGGVLLSAASIASKVIMPGAVFPIGIVTAMIGVPFFFWLVLTSRRSFW